MLVQVEKKNMFIIHVPNTPEPYTMYINTRGSPSVTHIHTSLQKMHLLILSCTVCARIKRYLLVITRANHHLSRINHNGVEESKGGE